MFSYTIVYVKGSDKYLILSTTTRSSQDIRSKKKGVSRRKEKKTHTLPRAMHRRKAKDRKGGRFLEITALETSSNTEQRSTIRQIHVEQRD